MGGERKDKCQINAINNGQSWRSHWNINVNLSWLQEVVCWKQSFKLAEHCGSHKWESYISLFTW